MSYTNTSAIFYGDVIWTDSATTGRPLQDITSYKSLILGDLAVLYTTTEGARLLDYAADNLKLRFAGMSNADSTGSPAYGLKVSDGYSQDVVQINYSQAANVYYLDKYGTLNQSFPAIVIAHELAHIVDDNTDPAAYKSDADMNVNGFDFAGPAVVSENLVAAALSLPERLSYTGSVYAYEGNMQGFVVGENYTEGNEIDVARVSGNGSSDIDHSDKEDNARDLIFGMDGNDRIYGGGGNDYLYGGLGSDLIHGGFNGTTDVQASTDGVDVAGYQELPEMGIQVWLSDTGQSTLYAAEEDFDRAIFVTGLESGGVDTLISIEKITGTHLSDQLTIDSLSSGRLADVTTHQGGLATVDLLGESDDFVDMGALDEAVKITVTDDKFRIAALAAPARGLDVYGVGWIQASNHDDDVDGTGASVAVVVYGGDGEDHLVGGELEDVLIGEDKDDYISGRESDDYLNGGAGDDVIYGGEGDDFILGEDGNDEIHSGSGAANTIYGGGDEDTIYFTAEGGGIAYGGTGDDTIDALGALAPVIAHYAIGDGTDTIAVEYDPAIYSLTLSDLSTVDVNTLFNRGPITVKFDDLDVSDLIAVWAPSTLLDSFVDGDFTEELYLGKLVIKDLFGTTLIDFGDAIGTKQVLDYEGPGVSTTYLMYSNPSLLTSMEYEFGHLELQVEDASRPLRGSLSALMFSTIVDNDAAPSLSISETIPTDFGANRTLADARRADLWEQTSYQADRGKYSVPVDALNQAGQLVQAMASFGTVSAFDAGILSRTDRFDLDRMVTIDRGRVSSVFSEGYELA